MWFGRWLSIGLGLGSAVLVAAALLYVQMSDIMPSRIGWVELTVTASAVGLLVGLLQWLFISSLHAELDRLIAHTESLGRSDSRIPLFRSRIGLHELSLTIDRSAGAMRSRLKQFNSRRRELELQVRVAEAEQAHAVAVLNAIGDAVIVTDAFNEVAMANESAARLLGFDLEHAIRRPLDLVVQDPVLVQLVKETSEGGSETSPPRRQLEHKLGIADSRGSATCNVTLTRVPGDDDGQMPRAAGVVTILRDVTQERALSEMKGDFVSNVSHELRTPLSSIKAYVEMLVDGEADNEAMRSEFYNIIQGEANRLQRLIDNILSISRIESGVVKVQREHIALPALIAEVVETMQPQARAQHVKLLEAPPPCSFQVFADRDMMYQATLNLVGNAIKYTPEGGEVTVGIEVDHDRRIVRVTVSDNGMGIPGEDLPHLFDKFYRVAGHKKVAKGTGLGLNLVKHIVETVHGGKVSVRSEVGAGSTFSYSLPLADEVSEPDDGDEPIEGEMHSMRRNMANGF